MSAAANRFKAVIFDLDGVITDTARYHYLAWKRLAERSGWACVGILGHRSVSRALEPGNRCANMGMVPV